MRVNRSLLLELKKKKRVMDVCSWSQQLFMTPYILTFELYDIYEKNQSFYDATLVSWIM